ncbi:MAG: co-chaperone GroES [Bacteroidia bacterium]|nr:co-chaperone GroES [Bacteroidia bacterium]
MPISVKEDSLSKIIMVGDRVLIKPVTPTDRTKSGLYLPEGVHEKENLHEGYVIKVGPGYPFPSSPDDDDSWKSKTKEAKYVPIQPKVGDLAVYLQKDCYDIEINNEKHVIAPQSAILFLIRDDKLFE